MKRLKQPTPAAMLRLEYLLHAAYYYYRADSRDESMASVLNRMRAQSIQQAMERMGQPVPEPAEVYAYARERFPKKRLLSKRKPHNDFAGYVAELRNKYSGGHTIISDCRRAEEGGNSIVRDYAEEGGRGYSDLSVLE